MTTTERNWARNLVYSAPVVHPRSVEELQEAVADADRVHALGTRHSFNPCADSDGLLLQLDGLDPALDVDAAAGTATVGAAVRVGDLGQALAAHGLAIANLPSLPHVSLAGAVATATHGSGDAIGTMSTFVRGLDVIGPDGALRHVSGDDLAGSVVALGALGVVVRVTVAVEPAFEIRQDAFSDLPWGSVEEHLDAVFAAAYSVSLITHWSSPAVEGVLVKSRSAERVRDFFGARPDAEDPASIGTDVKRTPLGTPGPSWELLPHFRMAAVPSVGEELQSEYSVPRATAPAAIAALRELGPRIDPVLHATEIRSVAADDLWLSPSAGTDVLAIGFTWKDEPDAVLPLIPVIEERLLPLGARPHWAKLFDARELRLRDHYPRWSDFAALRDEVDPHRVFGNAFLTEVLGS